MSEKRELKTSGEINKIAKITQQQHHQLQEPYTTATVPTMIPYNNTFYIIPDEVATKIIYFVGKEYLGIGVVNRRLNKIFKDSDIPNKTVYGGYASYKEMIDKFDNNMFSDICMHIATGIVYFDRKDLLEWAIDEKNKFVFYEILSKASITVAAKFNKLDCLRYLHEQGCTWKSTACLEAASNGNLECLKYLHEHGCPWNSDACIWATKDGKLDCLKYLHDHACPWSPDACKQAAANGHLDCLIFLHEHGSPWNEDTCTWAAYSGHIECLKYLHEHGCQWSSKACEEAAIYGKLECLQYLLEHGCECTPEACAGAALNGNLDCLKCLMSTAVSGMIRHAFGQLAMAI